MEDVKSSTEAVTVDRKFSCRIYPSLPQTDRYEAGVPKGAAAHGLHNRSTDTQEEAADRDRLKIQMLILEEQKKELLLINEKWAREYRTMKQFYSEKVRELRAILQNINSHTKEDICEGEKKTAAGTKVKDEERVKADEVGCSGEEAAELRLQNSSLTRRWQHQHQEIRRLNEALQGALQAGEGSNETLEDLWKHQAEVYREDFLKERSDREKLHGRYLELEKQYRKARRALRALNPQTLPTKAVADCRCRNATTSQNFTGQPPHRATCALNFRCH